MHKRNNLALFLLQGPEDGLHGSDEPKKMWNLFTTFYRNLFKSF